MQQANENFVKLDFQALFKTTIMEKYLNNVLKTLIYTSHVLL